MSGIHFGELQLKLKHLPTPQWQEKHFFTVVWHDNWESINLLNNLIRSGLR